MDRAKELVPSEKIHAHFGVGDSSSEETLKDVEKILKHRDIDGVDLAILHPPYFDIIRFSDKAEDLSNTESVPQFLESFGKVIHNTHKILKKK